MHGPGRTKTERSCGQRASLTLPRLHRYPYKPYPSKMSQREARHSPHLGNVVELLSFGLPKAAFSRLLDKVGLDSNRFQKQECVSRPNGKSPTSFEPSHTLTVVVLVGDSEISLQKVNDALLDDLVRNRAQSARKCATCQLLG